MIIIKKRTLTRDIDNKGFSDMQNFVVRFNLSCNLIGNSPKPLTVYIVKRYLQA